MIKSKPRDSGGFNKEGQSTSGAEIVADDNVTAKNPLIDTVFAEKYLITEVLGEGGMSVVYLARHEALNKLVAIKTLHAHLMSKTTSLMRFKQEAQAASRLQHPGIVAMHDYGVTEEGTPYLVMDYVSGESLADLLSRIKSLRHQDALDIFKQTTAAIAHAHERGVIHRDVKPSNIMLHFDERDNVHVKIVDFGVAKFVESEEQAKLTQTGESLGSPLYMSPEQCLGKPLDVRSDIYSFGCVMYEAITGHPALAGDSVFTTMMKQINDMPPSFAEIQPDLNDRQALERIVFKTLAKEPHKRYQRMQDVLDALNELDQESRLWQKMLHKFELTGLRRTTKSLNFAVAISFFLGASILLTASLGLVMLSSVSAIPNLQSEPPLWSAYKDKNSVRRSEGLEGKQMALDSLQNTIIESDEQAAKTFNPSRGLDKQRALDSLQNTIIESDEQAAKTFNPSQGRDKALELAFDRRSKGTAERNQHDYDSAKADFTPAIFYIRKRLDASGEMEHANALNNLMLAYMGRGDCEYFNSPPDYKLAGEDYGAAVQIMRKIKTNGVWIDVTTPELLQFIMRYSDCYFMQGRYGEALEKLSSVTQLRREDRELQEESYKALAKSKLAEEYFRLNKLLDAEREYVRAVKVWKSSGDSFMAEQSMAAGRLAEIQDKIGGDGQGDIYANFAELAAGVARTNPQQIHSPFFSNAYQSYAHYLWQRGDFSKAIEMHQLAGTCWHQP